MALFEVESDRRGASFVTALVEVLATELPDRLGVVRYGARSGRIGALA